MESKTEIAWHIVKMQQTFFLPKYMKLIYRVDFFFVCVCMCKRRSFEG